MNETENTLTYTEVEFRPGAHLGFGAEKTPWRVLELDRKAETALLIAEEPVCNRAYHDELEDITWEHCSLRKWLNEEYYEKTFSEEEKAAILECKLQNPDNPKYGTIGGNDTTDRIFLLSVEEAGKYFQNDRDRVTGTRWWLRSPGRSQYSAADIPTIGALGYSAYVNFIDYGVRPAFRINLKSDVFQSFISSQSPEAIMIKVPDLHIRGRKVLHAMKNVTDVTVPEGIAEITDSCFGQCIHLQRVKLPASLKKIGQEAFAGCSGLETVSGVNGAIVYGKDVFQGCKKLNYMPEMFRNTGKLCDSFADHLDVCGSKELAWLLLYQKGSVWKKALSEKVNKANASEILSMMTDHIGGLNKSAKKAAEGAVSFVLENSPILTGDEIARLCSVLQEKKLNETAEKLLSDPCISQKVNLDPGSETEERVMPDGSIWISINMEELKPGIQLWFGDERWRALEVDREAETAILIAEESVCDKAYHDKTENVTWEQCSLRKWLNGEYYEKAFSEEEKAAIQECELKNPDNPKYGTKGGNDTRDKVFLLSIDEAEKYFKDDLDRATGSWWWLRSPGGEQNYASIVLGDGVLGSYTSAGIHKITVRPAFRINLKSDFFQALISCNPDGRLMIRRPGLVVKSGVLMYVNPDLESVCLQSYVQKIAETACYRCRKLKSLSWLGEAPEIEQGAFVDCDNLHLPAEFYFGKKLPDERFAQFFPENDTAIANALLTAGAKSCYRGKAVDMLNERNASAVADELIRLIEERKEIKQAEMVLRFCLAAQGLLSPKQTAKLKELLQQKKTPGTSWIREENSSTGKLFSSIYAIPSILLSTECEEILKLPSLSDVYEAVSPYAEMYGQSCFDPKGYRKDAKQDYRKGEQADRMASEMDHGALMTLLKAWQAADGPKWYAPYAAFADDGELSALIAEMKTWEKDKYLRDRIIRVRGAILLNDTVTAMRYADSLGHLERYADLRGMDADDIRDNIISNFGLDENGKITWTLAGKEVTALLNPDLTLSLTDESGKLLKSVPKKGLDPGEYDAVSKEFASMKKDIKATAKTRNDKIFADFLSGRSRPGKAWRESWQKNPLLRIMGRLIVWEQDGTTFTLDGTGKAIEVNGTEYPVKDGPVKVAHPMEMEPGTTEAWQQYFTSHGLKQPFEQVWEPVTDPSCVKAGRYDGCTIPLYMLMNKEKHGILMEGQSRITLVGCSAGLKLIEGHHDWVNNEFEVSNFSFLKYDRQVNHIVAHLDKGTVAGRIKKDDISAAQWFDRFTLAQITDFIRLAQENNAVNVLAQLLEYKNAHFADFDPMDEFTLDLL